ncbi:MAG: hypothetical protein M3N29_02310 [Chloroflexota bacterium]|nr:hypothetical protein [Chloroflexota bacterium]
MERDERTTDAGEDLHSRTDELTDAGDSGGELAATKAFMPLAVPGMGVPHPGSVVGAQEAQRTDEPAPHSDEPTLEGEDPRAGRI